MQSKVNITPSPSQRYIGIIDSAGLESVLPLETADVKLLELRVRYSTGAQNRRLWAGHLNNEQFHTLLSKLDESCAILLLQQYLQANVPKAELSPF